MLIVKHTLDSIYPSYTRAYILTVDVFVENINVVTLPLGSRAARCAGSIPVTRTILVILNSCTPLKARIYELYLHFRDENFKVKTVAVFCSVLQEKGIRTDA